MTESARPPLRYLTTVIVASIGVMGCSDTLATSGTPLPLGVAAISQQHRTEQVAPGVVYRRILRGGPQIDASWLISTGVAWTSADVATASRCIAALGLTPRRLRYSAPGVADRPYSVVVGGAFPNRSAAAAAMQSPTADRCAYNVQNRSDEPDHGSGPWALHVLEIDPRLHKGGLRIELARGGIGGVAPTSEIARRTGAVAAVNGGYFVMHAVDGIVGDPVGLTVVGGRVVSEATRGRPILILRDSRPVSASIVVPTAKLEASIRWIDGTLTPLDGINRRPGLARDCGRPGGETGGAAAHDQTCTNPHEIIAFTPEAAPDPIPADSKSWWLRPDGRLEPVANGPNSPASIRIVATGRRAAELQSKSATAGRAHLDLGAASLELVGPADADRAYALNGGPTLLRGGRPVRRDRAEGWAIEPSLGRARATLIHNWSVRRNPRTAFGISTDGRLLMLIADGRGATQPTGRDRPLGVGLTIEELRRVMRMLGAVDAINLDGGGSSTLAVDAKVMNLPSDQGLERPVANAVLVTSP